MKVYLDNSATTRQYDRVTDAMTEAMRADYGNPSSLHAMGVTAEKAVRSSRKSVAKAIGAGEEEIYFTSCGTESDNMVLMGTAKARRRQGKKIITTAVEHPAVLEPCKALEDMGFEVEYIGVDSKCKPDMEQLKSAINDDTILISVMTVNNENGAIMPIEEIGRLKREYNQQHGTRILLHTDGVQGLGKITLSCGQNLSDVDFASFSAHKIHGPKGIGALWMRKGNNLPAYMMGGGQERHMRSGTENTPGIIGFGLAAQISTENFQQRVKQMQECKDYLQKGICEEIKDIIINTPTDEDENNAAPSVLNVSFLGTRGEVILHTLEQEGIYVSTGSACSSNKKGMSHVLKAMGLKDKEIEGAIRFSFSQFNTKEEMDYVLCNLKTAVERFRRLGSFR